MLNFVFVKGYGDFIIGSYFIKQLSVEDKLKIRLLITPRIQPLSNLIDPSIQTSVINYQSNDAPALFSIKKNGPVLGLESAISLRKAFSELNKEKSISGPVIFDKASFRERFIAPKTQLLELPRRQPNIYKAYTQLFENLNLSLKYQNIEKKINHEKKHQSIGVFPTSGVIEKDIPAEVIASFYEICSVLKKELCIYVFPEDFKKYSKLPNVTIIRKDFSELIKRVKSHNLVMSADSMPAHLSQFYGISVFVLMRDENNYWLPAYSFENERYSTFNEILLRKKNNIERISNFITSE